MSENPVHKDAVTSDNSQNKAKESCTCFCGQQGDKCFCKSKLCEFLLFIVFLVLFGVVGYFSYGKLKDYRSGNLLPPLPGAEDVFDISKFDASIESDEATEYDPSFLDTIDKPEINPTGTPQSSNTGSGNVKAKSDPQLEKDLKDLESFDLSETSNDYSDSKLSDLDE